MAMTDQLTCNTCGTTFIGYDWKGRECNICRGNREANERFEKESAQRERHYNQSYRSTSSSSTYVPEFNSRVFFSKFIGFVVGAWLLHAILSLDFNLLVVIFGGCWGGAIGGLIAESK